MSVGGDDVDHDGPESARMIAVGLPRTGTRFLAGMVAAPWSARHEFDLTRQAFVASSYLRGEATPQAVRNYLVWRRETIGTSSDISSSNQDVADVLAEIVESPQSPAVYVLTVRDPLEWVDAYARAILMWAGAQPVYERLRAARCRPDLWRHLPADGPMQELGLFSLDAYLYWWAKSTARVLTTIPEEQLLTIPTKRLTHAGEELAAATGWPRSAFRPQDQHQNNAPRWEDGGSIIDRLDPEHVALVVERQLGNRYWGPSAGAFSFQTRKLLGG